MNIFFYTAGESMIAVNYLEQLKSLPNLEAMIVLPKRKLFSLPVALQLRTGDLIILFVANRLELDELLTLKNELNDFRIILIVADNVNSRKAYMLNPSFVAFHYEPLIKIEAVIQNITEKEHV